jgi:hypothetical protein
MSIFRSSSLTGRPEEGDAGSAASAGRGRRESRQTRGACRPALYFHFPNSQFRIPGWGPFFEPQRKAAEIGGVEYLTSVGPLSPASRFNGSAAPDPAQMSPRVHPRWTVDTIRTVPARSGAEAEPEGDTTTGQRPRPTMSTPVQTARAARCAPPSGLPGTGPTVVEPVPPGKMSL